MQATRNNTMLTENVTVHWHGIRKYGTPWHAGTDGITQCAIMPGETLDYKFVVESATLRGHSMTVFEADGSFVEPFVTKNLYINSGETYSVIVKADRDSKRNDWITTKTIGRKPSTPTGLGIFNYYPIYHYKCPITEPTTGPLWNDTASKLAQSRAIKAHPDYVTAPPPTSDIVIVLFNTQNLVNGIYR
uniref:Plastocyanin-like domain-containing protein n=1 Tax=Quercus lobata TaxID=97700 RepID=A0A7N2LIA4_QUELO